MYLYPSKVSYMYRSSCETKIMSHEMQLLYSNSHIARQDSGKRVTEDKKKNITVSKPINKLKTQTCNSKLSTYMYMWETCDKLFMRD